MKEKNIAKEATFAIIQKKKGDVCVKAIGR